ncbi:MAG: hypothetical protein AB8H80_03305 [Planctomycetota bacterium]
MDAGAFVQENKQWLIGCAIGGLIWWIASGVIGSMYNPADTKMPRPGPKEGYGVAALDAADEEGEQLRAERQRLEGALQFEVADAFGKWSGPADQHLFLTGRNLKRAIADGCALRDATVDDGDVAWDVASGVDEIRRRLFGLDMVAAVRARLFAAHDAVLERDEDAAGLVAIDSIKVDSQRGRRRPARRRGRRRAGDSVDVSDRLSEERVQIQVQADAETLFRFLESCRESGRTLLVESWRQTQPTRPGEPCTLKASLLGVTVAAAAAGNDEDGEEKSK